MVRAVVEPADSGPLRPFTARVKAWGTLTTLAVAPAAVSVAFALRALFNPILQHDAPYLFFVPAVLVAAMRGLGPGLLATALGLVLGSFFVASVAHPSAAEMLSAAIFTLIGVGIAWGGEQLQRNRRRATASAQDALAREAHLKSILDTVVDAMVVIDERGTMQSFSSAAERLFGYTAAEVLGKNVNILMPSPYRESHDAYIERYKQTG